MIKFDVVSKSNYQNEGLKKRINFRNEKDHFEKEENS